MEILIKTSFIDKLKIKTCFLAMIFFLFLAKKCSLVIFRYDYEFLVTFSSVFFAPLVARFDALDYEDRGYSSYDCYMFDIVYNGCILND